MKSKISRISIRIHGAGLRVDLLSERFQKEPGVIRGPKRKRIFELDDREATYCFFSFEANSVGDDIQVTLQAFFNEFYAKVLQTSKEEFVHSLSLDIPIYLSEAHSDLIPVNLLQMVSDVNASIGFDFYFDAPDVIPPPEAVTSG